MMLRYMIKELYQNGHTEKLNKACKTFLALTDSEKVDFLINGNDFRLCLHNYYNIKRNKKVFKRQSKMWAHKTMLNFEQNSIDKDLYNYIYVCSAVEGTLRYDGTLSPYLPMSKEEPERLSRWERAYNKVKGRI